MEKLESLRRYLSMPIFGGIFNANDIEDIIKVHARINNIPYNK